MIDKAVKNHILLSKIAFYINVYICTLYAYLVYIMHIEVNNVKLHIFINDILLFGVIIFPPRAKDNLTKSPIQGMRNLHSSC